MNSESTISEGKRIDDLVAIVASILAGTNDRIYPAHAELIVEPLERLAADAAARDDQSSAKSLLGSLERVRRSIPLR